MNETQLFNEVGAWKARAEKAERSLNEARAELSDWRKEFIRDGHLCDVMEASKMLDDAQAEANMAHEDQEKAKRELAVAISWWRPYHDKLRERVERMLGDTTDKMITAERERDEMQSLLVRWCYAEGGVDGERLFEDTMKVLDPEDKGHGLVEKLKSVLKGEE